MKREEFLMEAALRLVTANPGTHMSTIAHMARKLTGYVFDAAKEADDEGTWWPDDVDVAKVKDVVDYVEKSSCNSGSGYGKMLTRLFVAHGIATVGQLLRLGRPGFSALTGVGKGSVTRVDDALEGLYEIKSW